MTAPLSGTRLQARLRRGCAAAVLVELRRRNGALATNTEVAEATHYAPSTAHGALRLAEAAGFTYQAPLPGQYPPVAGWALTGKGLAFAATIRTEIRR